MLMQSLALASIEKTINLALAWQPLARQKMAELSGRVIGLHVQGLEINLYCIPTAQGKIRIYSQYEYLPDTVISGTPLDLLSAMRSDASEILSSPIQINGDQHLAEQFSRILAHLDLDWHEIIAHSGAAPLAYPLDWLERKGQSIYFHLKSSLEQNSRAWIEQKKIVADRICIESFLKSVDQIRDDVDRLEARIQQLEHDTD